MYKITDIFLIVLLSIRVYFGYPASQQDKLMTQCKLTLLHIIYTTFKPNNGKERGWSMHDAWKVSHSALFHPDFSRHKIDFTLDKKIS